MSLPIAHVSKVMFYVTLIHHHKIHSILLHMKNDNRSGTLTILGAFNYKLI